MTILLSAQPISSPTNRYHGRCLCGAVRFQVQLDARSDGALWGFSVWECIVAPSNFTLLAGADELSGHQFAAKSAHHFFCERCGTRSFSHYAESACGEFYGVDLRSLDGVIARSGPSGSTSRRELRCAPDAVRPRQRVEP